jgi:ABC-type sulfate transport system substrate-binding protein
MDDQSPKPLVQRYHQAIAVARSLTIDDVTYNSVRDVIMH